MRARYPGKCQLCERPYEIGDDVVAYKPSRKRRYWIVRHKLCHKNKAAGGAKVTTRFECPVCGGGHSRADHSKAA